MARRSIGPDGDLELLRARPVLVDGSEAVRQRLAARLRLFLGEWFLDTSKGFPWAEVAQLRSIDLLRQRLIAWAVGTLGVARVLSVALEVDESLRKVTGTMRVQTDSGDSAALDLATVSP